jgi:hypothetical protein
MKPLRVQKREKETCQFHIFSFPAHFEKVTMIKNEQYQQ